MRLNPFHWLNEHPTFRVVGGWLLLAAVMIVNLAWPSIPLGPLFCLPVIMIGYDTRIGRGILISIVVSAAWVLLSTNAGMSLWSNLVESQVAAQIPEALQKQLVKRGLSIPPMDPKEEIPTAIVLWLVGSGGFLLVALGFYTIRMQEHKLAVAESDRIGREKTILNAITTTLNHEINNPLAIISAQTGLMEIENGTDKQRAKSLHSIQEAVQRIADFVKELSAIEEVRLKHMGSTFTHIDWHSDSQPPPPQ